MSPLLWFLLGGYVVGAGFTFRDVFQFYREIEDSPVHLDVLWAFLLSLLWPGFQIGVLIDTIVHWVRRKLRK